MTEVRNNYSFSDNQVYDDDFWKILIKQNRRDFDILFHNYGVLGFWGFSAGLSKV